MKPSWQAGQGEVSQGLVFFRESAYKLETTISLMSSLSMFKISLSYFLLLYLAVQRDYRGPRVLWKYNKRVSVAIHSWIQNTLRSGELARSVVNYLLINVLANKKQIHRCFRMRLLEKGGGGKSTCSPYSFAPSCLEYKYGGWSSSSHLQNVKIRPSPCG